MRNICLIVAHSKNMVIGNNNGIPWKSKKDMDHFKKSTTGKTVIMGKNTFESIGSKPLKNRHNIVLSRSTGVNYPDGVTVANSIEDALSASDPSIDVFFMGGQKIYEQCIPYCNRLFITEIYEDFDGDTHFPEIDRTQWKEVCRQFLVDNGLSMSFIVYDRL